MAGKIVITKSVFGIRRWKVWCPVCLYSNGWKTWTEAIRSANTHVAVHRLHHPSLPYKPPSIRSTNG